MIFVEALKRTRIIKENDISMFKLKFVCDTRPPPPQSHQNRNNYTTPPPTTTKFTTASATI